jgi:hypothetical protein
MVTFCLIAATSKHLATVFLFFHRVLRMSAIGTKRASLVALHMSALGVKRTCLFALQMSAYDPKRTSASALQMSAFGGKADVAWSYCPMALGQRADMAGPGGNRFSWTTVQYPTMARI